MQELQREIAALEFQKRAELDQVKQSFATTKEQFAPMSLLHDGLKDAFHDRKIQNGVLDGMLSLATGFLTKKAIVGSSGGIFRQVLGLLVQTGATSALFQNSDKIKSRVLPSLARLVQKLKIN